MCARNEDRDQLLTDSICRGHPQIKVQSVASSAGATATASIVNQPVNGHLNGRPTDPFDQEECYARCTVAATRAQGLTVIISQLDMAGMMGMMQVLAARARPIHQVYHGATTWTLPSLRGMSHQEQSDAEVASWDISRASSWSEQTLPPLALTYKRRSVEAGETKTLTLLKRCLPYFKRAEQICFLETCCQKTKVVRACLRVVDITVCYVIVVPLLRCISTRPIFIFKLFSQQTFVSKKHLFGEHFWILCHAVTFHLKWWVGGCLKQIEASKIASGHGPGWTPTAGIYSFAGFAVEHHCWALPSF